MEEYNPPYTITNKIVNLISDITELLTRISINLNNKLNSNPKLRKNNRVKTIQATLAIENNTLTLEQVTDIINGKRVLGPPKEICEIKNAFEAYEILLSLNPYKIKDLLYIHKILMKDLTNEIGVFRSKGVGIFAEEKLVHMAPPAHIVPDLMKKLFEWVETQKEIHPLIKSCVFHYEIEFIHPFTDGNGRMGRMWQTLLLYKWNEIFGWIPIETLIKENQMKYYEVLGECDKLGELTKFIEFMLEIIYKTLLELKESDQVNDQESDQVKKIIEILKDKELSANEIMEKLGLKHKPTFRKNYLKPALEKGIIEMTIPDKPNSKNQKYKLK
jgi:Fic family protein